MKKNTVKKLNTVFVSGVAILLILTVFFCSFSPCISVFASEEDICTDENCLDCISQTFTSDCPDCEDGTNIIQSIVDCTASGCVDGSVTTQLSSTCSGCSGVGTITTTKTSTCSVCSGKGYYYVKGSSFSDDDGSGYRYNIYVCTSCGGKWITITSSGCNVYSSADVATICAQVVSSDVNLGFYAIGIGSVKTVTSSDCPDCTDGNIYSSITSDCTTCLGAGEIVSYSTITCPTCDGETIIYIGLDDISTIPTVVTTEDGEVTVTFTYTETGDVGDLEFVWYLNDTAYRVTDTASITLSGLPTGVYGMYCKINSSVGFYEYTNQFEVQVNLPSEITYIQISDQPSNFMIKQGEAVTIQLDYDDVADIVWFVNETAYVVDVADVDLSVLEIGVYEIYCEYTLDNETITSEIATVSVVNEDGLTEELNNAWDNFSAGFWAAVGGAAALAILGVVFAVKVSKE